MSDTNILKTFKAGETVMRQGDPGDCAYIIEEGRVEIFIEAPDGKKQSVGTRGAGTMIGEMAIVDRALRTATIKAVEDCKFLQITSEDFERRLKKADPILRMATHVILTRYRDTLLRAAISSKAPLPTEAIELNYAVSNNDIERVKLDKELKAAFDKGELHLNYQPIIDLKTGRIAGFESLMRWTHPERGNIPPSIFIPSAEETGLIHDLSRWALQESCEALARIEKTISSEQKLFVSVNFSGSDFAVEGFVDHVGKAVRNSGIKPEQLHIEMTEQILMTHPGKAKLTLLACAEAGYHMSIDDFGTGYSSLSYLHHFPIHTLKIDRSFIFGMTENEGSLALVKSIIALGKNLDMTIIAEGAEIAAEVEALKKLGCDMVQGYFFAKPMSEASLIDYISGNSAISSAG
jgi:EAL domain-containing protein (putative c-di-GMP-specific phosphodiesterase class I)